MKVVIKHPGEAAMDGTLENTVTAIQAAVDGHFETVNFANGVTMIVNEEGKLNSLPENFRLWNDMIVGTAVFVGVDGEEFTDCPVSAEQIQKIIDDGNINHQTMRENAIQKMIKDGDFESEDDADKLRRRLSVPFEITLDKITQIMVDEEHKLLLQMQEDGVNGRTIETVHQILAIFCSRAVESIGEVQGAQDGQM